MEITLKKSQELAAVIEGMKIYFHLMDVDYAKAAVAAMFKQADFEDSAAPLNRNYDPVKGKLLRIQAKMLDSIVGMIEIGKKVDEIKKELSKSAEYRKEIEKLFI